MKIALVHMRHAYSGGTELFLNQLAVYLVEKGEDVTIICRSHMAPPDPRVKFVKLGGLAFGKGHRMWKFARAVEKHLSKKHYDFVYGLGKTWTHDMLRIGGGTHLDLLNSMLDGHKRLKDKVAIAIERRAMAKGAYRHIVANSYKSASEIQSSYGVPESQISVIHNFVDTQRFDRERVKDKAAHLKRDLGLSGRLPIFLFFGSGYERKGLKEAMQAFSKLDFPAWLLIAGRENHQDEYKDYANTLGITESCRFMGEQREPELWFSIADCYVLPTKYEPFGFTVIEALSCGTPVITTENCGAKEVLSPSVSTVVGSDVDSSDIADAMNYWAQKRDDPELLEECRDSVLKLDISEVMEQNYQKILEVYRGKGA
jgi:UDP-glucose:(heptosyl)LPS alpha-1,3-glucosyltransferase